MTSRNTASARPFILFLAAVTGAAAALAGGPVGAEELPEAWHHRWREPAREDRPLQIVHGLDPRRAMPSGIDQMVARPDSAESEPRGMGYYADLGLGGIVCNVAFQDYMRSDEHWKTLQRSQIPFALIDHQQLAAAKVGMDGKLSIGDPQFEAIVVPRGAQLPAPAAAVVDTWRARGGRVVVDQADIPLDRESLIRDLPRTQRLVPESDRITLGQFRRDGRRVLLAVNVGREPYEGSLVVNAGGMWQVLDPADGSMRATGTDGANGVPLVLDRYQAVLLVENPRGSVP